MRTADLSDGDGPPFLHRLPGRLHALHHDVLGLLQTVCLGKTYEEDGIGPDGDVDLHAGGLPCLICQIEGYLIRSRKIQTVLYMHFRVGERHQGQRRPPGRLIIPEGVHVPPVRAHMDVVIVYRKRVHARLTTYL